MTSSFYHLLLAFCTLVIIVSCDKKGQLERCDPPLKDAEFYANQSGILTLSDSTYGRKLPYYKYFIYSDEITYAPLELCNPSGISHLLQEGDTVLIEFSGNLYNIPDDIMLLYAIPFELTYIRTK